MSEQPDAQRKKLQRLFDLNHAFTPGTPIQSLNDFSGRWALISEAYGVISQRGMHVALFGDRGVGKTSLANILGESFTDKTMRAIRSVRYQCNSGDTYRTLWEALFRKLDMAIPDDWVATPPNVIDLLKRGPFRSLIVIDEVDRFDDQDGLSLLADTIKALSDEASEATLVLVGVSDSLEHLIGDHQSVGRALVQMKVERMTTRDLRMIVSRGFEKMGLRAPDDQVERIALLSEGLPHYTHLLAYHAAQSAIHDDRNDVSAGDVANAIRRSLDKAQDSIRNAYAKATFSPRRDNLFKQVLVACALTQKDETGSFSPGAVSAPLAKVLGRKVSISAFTRHLNDFSTEDHGSVLQKRGKPRRWAYRFADPMLQPYALLRGLADDLVTEKQLAEMRTPAVSEIPDAM